MSGLGHSVFITKEHDNAQLQTIVKWHERG